MNVVEKKVLQLTIINSIIIATIKCVAFQQNILDTITMTTITTTTRTAVTTTVTTTATAVEIINNN